ncbi:MAG: hypothetical protein CL927_10040 [Deltaproteobacteria bacterium]|nr:hypothetical protein [Deltaproteobacteria bacterium]HCH61512.1 hypothetical protein [Deltaproteobacteria bacterium]
MTPSSIPSFVNQAADLDVLVERLSSEPMLALDTEFHAERRYRPDLMLVQIAAPAGRVFTIDPLALDLTPLHPVLHDKTWVAHGAQRDVELLHAATGARPARLLDTQVMAGFADLHYPARLDDLALEVLDVQIDKGATLSDWHRRPLSEEQLRYAQADVSLLCPLVEALRARIANLDAQISNRHGTAWITHAGKEQVDEALSSTDPHRHWRTLEIAPKLNAPTRAALHALYAWREAEARHKNSPPHYILTPSIALDLARRRPSDLSTMRENRRIPGGLIKRHGETLLQILAEASRADPPPRIPAIGRRGVRPLLDAWMQQAARDLAIAPKLLAPAQLSRKIAVGGTEALEGWRSLAMHGGIQSLLRGEISLSIGEDGIVTTPVDHRSVLHAPQTRATNGPAAQG